MKPSLRIVTLLAALLGCSGEEDPTESLAGELPFYPVPGCESVEHAPCDVRAEACQTQLLAMAACLRGSESVELPPIEMIDKAEYARRLREGLGTAARPDPDHEEAAFVLLRLIPVDGFGTEALVAEAVDFVGGFYDSDTQAITLVDAGSDLTARDWSALMVHEFIHYLQDKQLSLAAWREHYRASEDTWFALRALVEGEAQFHQLRYVASLSRFDPARVSLDAFFASRISQDEIELVQSNSAYLVAPYRFPYDWGGRYVGHAWRMAGHAGVHERFADPPTTTHALMASETGVYVPEFEPTTPQGPLAVPAEWALTHEHQLGALVTFLALGQRTSDPELSRALALAWRGDRLFVYGAENDDTTAVVWRIDFADETSAQLAAAVFSSPARAVGTRVTVALTDGRFALDWAF
jgi:hypothetical protein